MDINKFMFPVEEKDVYLINPKTDLPKITDDYKAILRADNHKLISIMKNTYEVVPNSLVINPLMDELTKFDTPYYIDSTHSFVEDNRMRLQVTFPDLTMNDGTSDIALSLFLHNSYDGSEGVRMFWGAIRYICSNGMVFGILLSKYYRKHTQGINIKNLKEQLQITYEKIPLIQSRIDELCNTPHTEDMLDTIEKKMGKTVAKYIKEQSKLNQIYSQWILFNMVTYYISHIIPPRLRAPYQLETSKIFKL